jgi:hypothetical protein
MKQLLIDARSEILRLRTHNEILSAQMQVVDIFAAALGLKHNFGGMTPDIAWELEKKIEELDDTSKVESKEAHSADRF